MTWWQAMVVGGLGYHLSKRPVDWLISLPRRRRERSSGGPAAK